MQDLQSAVRHAPVPDVIDDDLTTFVMYQVYHAVITRAYPVEMFSAGKFVCIMGNWFLCQFFYMLKIVWENFSGNFPDSLFSALFEGD